MKKFINTKTGNVVRAKNAATIALMEKSTGYKEVTGKTAKGGNKPADGADGGNKPADGADGGKSE